MTLDKMSAYFFCDFSVFPVVKVFHNQWYFEPSLAQNNLSLYPCTKRHAILSYVCMSVTAHVNQRWQREYDKQFIVALSKSGYTISVNLLWQYYFVQVHTTSRFELYGGYEVRSKEKVSILCVERLHTYGKIQLTHLLVCYHIISRYRRISYCTICLRCYRTDICAVAFILCFLKSWLNLSMIIVERLLEN